VSNEWPSDLEAALRRLWGEGHSTAEIGRRLGVSKNAVVGKAHRMGLPDRPSPIRRRGPNDPAPVKKAPRARAATLPPLQSMSAPPARPAVEVRVQPRDAVPEIVSAPAPARIPEASASVAIAALAEIARPAAAPAPARILRSPGKCEYLKGRGARSRDWIRCEAEREGGTPYCGEHRALCYTKLRKKDEGDGE